MRAVAPEYQNTDIDPTRFFFFALLFSIFRFQKKKGKIFHDFSHQIKIIGYGTLQSLWDKDLVIKPKTAINKAPVMQPTIAAKFIKHFLKLIWFFSLFFELRSLSWSFCYVGRAELSEIWLWLFLPELSCLDLRLSWAQTSWAFKIMSLVRFY